jgi:pimeloyl-ACP methyl ester carboxylesterase
MTVNERTFMVSVEGEALQVRQLRPEGLAIDNNTPTLVFLHDGLGSVAQWRGFPETLVNTTGLPALLYDRCGSGGSGPSSDPGDNGHFDRETIRLAALLRVCSIEQPVLIGHSDGATIALQFAADKPNLPLGVISLAAHLFAEEETLGEIRRAGERYRNDDLREKLLRFHGDNTDRLFATWSSVWEDALSSGWNVEERLKKVLCPVLALQGDQDEYGTLRQVQAIAVGVSGPCTQSILPGCGHFPHLTARDETLAALNPFILGLIGPSGPGDRQRTVTSQ